MPLLYLCFSHDLFVAPWPILPGCSEHPPLSWRCCRFPWCTAGGSGGPGRRSLWLMIVGIVLGSLVLVAIVSYVVYKYRLRVRILTSWPCGIMHSRRAPP